MNDILKIYDAISDREVPVSEEELSDMSLTFNEVMAILKKQRFGVVRSEESGHVFHGNQYTEGTGSANPHIIAGRFLHNVVNSEANDTQQAYTNKDGSITQERLEQVHEPALRELQAGVPTAPEGKPVVYMTGGGFGSGKSSLLRSDFRTQTGFPEKGQAVHIDPDALKEKIPEYKKLATPGEHYWNGAPSFVHEESSDLATRAVSESLKHGKSVIYDTSGDTGIEKLHGKVQAMRQAGASKVVGNYAFPGSVEEAQLRADARAANNVGARRFVDPAILKANHRDVAKTWLAAAKRGTFDKLNLWSTAGKRGSKPKLIAEAMGGGIKIHDPTQFANFKAISEQ